MKKTITFATAILVAITFIPASYAEPSVQSRLQELKKEREVKRNTLSPPLFSGGVFGNVSSIRNLSLLESPYQVGHLGSLDFKKMGETSFRIRYQDLEESASFFWIFEQKLDLRDRWLEIVYSSIVMPTRVDIVVDSKISRKDSTFPLYFENSLKPRKTYFKLPDRMPFSKVKKLRLVFEPEVARDADFMILDMNLLPLGAGPLGNAVSDISRFDWYEQPFQAQNKAQFNTELTF